MQVTFEYQQFSLLGIPLSWKKKKKKEKIQK